jgi:opacity protein-like surface antigen
VAAWLSETVLRGRGPGASGFESHRRGRVFSKEGTSTGPWMRVYVFQGLTVGWWKEERHSSDTTARSAGFKSRPDEPLPWMFVLYFVLCCPERKKEKSGWAWVAGVSIPEPRRTQRKKREEKTSRPDRPVR